MRASVHIKLPMLGQRKSEFNAIADQYHVQIRGAHGEHTETNDGIYDISNKRRLGPNMLTARLIRIVSKNCLIFGLKSSAAEMPDFRGQVIIGDHYIPADLEIEDIVAGDKMLIIYRKLIQHILDAYASSRTPLASGSRLRAITSACF